MEKRRRARINQSLSVLKSIILQEKSEVFVIQLFNSYATVSSKDKLNERQKTATSYSAQSRLEKADILELTVMHLRSLEKKQSTSDSKQQSAALASSTTSTAPTMPTVCGAVHAESCSNTGVDLKSYLAGYQTCCIDLEHILDQNETRPLTKERLLHHLQLRIGMQQETSARHSNSVADVNISPTRLGTQMHNHLHHRHQQFTAFIILNIKHKMINLTRLDIII